MTLCSPLKRAGLMLKPLSQHTLCLSVVEEDTDPCQASIFDSDAETNENLHLGIKVLGQISWWLSWL